MQVLDGLPMVAYAGESDDISEGLQFKHLTAAITVRVKNEKEETLELDRVMLINDQFKMSGTVTVDISQNPIVVDTSTPGTPDTVTVHFTDEKKTIAPGGYVDVQIPILPVGKTKSTFTIKAVGHHTGSSFHYERTTPERNNQIERARIGYAVAKFASDAPASDLFEQQTITVNGQEKNFYEISTPDELLTLADAMDNKWENSTGETMYHQGNYIVTEDLDMNGSKIVPIHYYNENNDERCYFDGQNHTISNFVASSVGEKQPNCCGLFGETGGDSITIKNVKIDSAEYEFAHTNKKIICSENGFSYTDNNPSTAVGGIYAVIRHAGIEIVNCTVSHITMGSTGNVMSGENQTDFYAAGLVGLVTTGVTIRNCYVGTVEVENNETNKNALVDQFGAAIGRVDVGYSQSENSYQYIVETLGKPIDSVPTVRIENFTYEQGTTELTFCAGLKNVRYGGLIANMARGGVLIMDNCHVHHNVGIDGEPTSEMYLSGLVGCHKNSPSGTIGGKKYNTKMALCMKPNCSVSGNIRNNAVPRYYNKKNMTHEDTVKNDKFQINKYYSLGPNCVYPIAGHSATCTNELTVSGLTTSFKTSDQKY